MTHNNIHLEAYNNTGADFSKMKLHELLENSFQNHKDQIAIKDFENEVTYEELFSNAVNLSKNILTKDQPIAVMANRNINTITQIYSILISGNYFVPIDPSAPESRKRQIIDKTNARYLFDGEMLNELHKKNVELPFQEKLIDGDQLAYVMFTSRSTGEPKGVVETHHQVYNTLFDIDKRMALQCDDGFLCLASLCFDLSIFDIFGAALAGGTLHLVNDQRNFNEIKSVIENNKISVWNSVPSVMDYFLKEIELTEKARNNMKVCLMSGDYISKELAQTVITTFSSAKFYSLGGATECSIWSILYQINQSNINDYSFVPYGYPMSNQNLWILNEKNELNEYGEEGQIAISGHGVALGYINDNDKTASTFIEHPQLGYLYLTGDIGKFVSPHHMKFIGRKDSRVKVNGYRVSLNQISTIFYNDFEKKNKVVLIKDEKGKDKIVLIYESVMALDSLLLRSKLSESLTLYEMPHLFYDIKEFPLTDNGKVDQKKLTLYASEVSELRAQRLAQNESSFTQNTFRTMLSEVFSIESLSYNDSLFDLGVDSIQLVKIKNWIKENEKKEITLLDIYTLDEIGKLEERIYS